MNRLLLLLAIAGCSSKSSSSSPTAPAPAPSAPAGSATPTPVPDDNPASVKPGIGEKCGDGDACANGLTCVSYYGIAGPRGPQFKSCEIKCEGASAQCPEGKKCITIADGPGQVCR